MALRVFVKGSYTHICFRNLRVFLVLKGETDWAMGRQNFLEYSERHNDF